MKHWEMKTWNCGFVFFSCKIMKNLMHLLTNRLLLKTF